jgi:hypothetical protein
MAKIRQKTQTMVYAQTILFTHGREVSPFISFNVRSVFPPLLSLIDTLLVWLIIDTKFRNEICIHPGNVMFVLLIRLFSAWSAMCKCVNLNTWGGYEDRTNISGVHFMPVLQEKFEDHKRVIRTSKLKIDRQ